ncbi:MAG: sugar phosphate isomerase/epimerase [Cytophagales bacterium]|nr:sugar phosphate isomerase/epimerase [Cytophagales bacterium]
MNLKFFCPIWGSDYLPFDTFCDKVKRDGFDGVEMGLPHDKMKKQELIKTLEHFELELIGQHYETLEPDFDKHKKIFLHHLENLIDSPALFINSQTGKDYYSFDQNKALIEIADQVSKNSKTPILHETHRGKFSFAAHIMKGYLEKLPGLRITLDISHWCNVAETFLEDQEEAVNMAIEHTDHIHSRVGYQEGPQIPDPRAPEWQDTIEIHAKWWDRVLELKEKSGIENFTITTEFGAPPYLLLMPFTRQPITSQWEINVYMMHLLKSRYEPINRQT